MIGWAAFFLFLIVYALSTLLNGAVFKTGGSPEISLNYLIRISLNPQFMGVLFFGFAGAVLKMFTFNHFGISRSLILTEAVVILNVALAAHFFGEELSPKFWIGCIIIGIGVVLIQSK
jgi:uncharacterized membrane protein